MTLEVLVMGRLLRALRRARGMTQEELASRLGLTQSQVSKVEAGRLERTFHETYQHAIELGLHMSELVALWESAVDRASVLGPAFPGPNCELATVAVQRVMQQEAPRLSRAAV